MARYSQEFKHSIIRKMMPPNNQSIASIAQETGLSEGTLFKWKNEAKAKGFVIADGETNTDRWSSRDKFQIVVESSSLNEEELAEYCRKKGLFVEQVQAWQNACVQANGGLADEASRLQKELRQRDRDFKKLERDLKRKDAALAETAALLVLRKKARAIWGDPDDE